MQDEFLLITEDVYISLLASGGLGTKPCFYFLDVIQPFFGSFNAIVYCIDELPPSLSVKFELTKGQKLDVTFISLLTKSMSSTSDSSALLIGHSDEHVDITHSARSIYSAQR